MRFKNLDTAIKNNFVEIVVTDYNFFNEHGELYVSPDSILSNYFNDYLVFDIGESRRGQHYYILCNKETLVLSVIASEADGSGSDIDIANSLLEMILSGDIIA